MDNSLACTQSHLDKNLFPPTFNLLKKAVFVNFSRIYMGPENLNRASAAETFHRAVFLVREIDW
jgi:hypothetical protein